MSGQARGEPGCGRLRNIGIVAHINAGKTTLSERILFATGKQRFIGEVDDGTATMDFLAEEQRRGISIAAAVTRVEWKGHSINLIDTPGHVDFTAEVERSLRVLDGVVVVLDGVKGVESQTETVWRRADEHRIPRLVFVNKMDRAGADFPASVQALKERLRCRPVAIVQPLLSEGQFVGLVDVIRGQVEQWSGPPADVDLKRMRATVVEACADFDETVLADFVEERPVGAERLDAALRRGVLAGALVPVLAGAALLNRGVAALLDAICRYLPSPLDAGAVRALDGAGGERLPAEDAPFCALVFKTHADPDDAFYVARVYSGTLRPGAVVASSSSGDPFTVGALWLVHADHREPVDCAGPGDVIALEARAHLRTGDTLFAPGHPIRLEPVHFPRPVLSARLEPLAPADAAVIEREAAALAADDPSLLLDRDAEGAGLVVSGMGELHLEVFESRLRRRTGDRARLGRPTVAFLETVARPGRGRAECRHKGREAMQAVVAVELVPERGGGAARLEVMAPGPPTRLEPLARELSAWLLVGLADPYPAVDLVVRLVEVTGDAHGTAGAVLDLEALRVACRKAVLAAGPVLLEPLMRLGVDCPADALSAVLADLKSRGARLESVTATGDRAEVRVTVRLAAVLGYATRLRSLTRGLGTASVTPAGYAPLAPEKRSAALDPLDPPR